MPVLQFKGKTAVEQHHRLVPHHVLEPDAKLSLTKKPGLDGNLIIEGDNPCTPEAGSVRLTWPLGWSPKVGFGYHAHRAVPPPEERS